MKWLVFPYTLFILFVAFLGFIFSSRNAVPIAPDLFGHTLPEWGVGIWLVVFLGFGCLSGMTLMLPIILRGKRKGGKLKKQLLGHQIELDKLRTTPFNEK